MDGRIRWRQAFTPVALAFVSLLAALALWVAVTDAENPSVVRDFPGTIPLQPVSVPDGLAVYLVSQPGSTSSLAGVRVRVRGPEDQIDDLTTGNFSATIDLTRAPEGIGTYQVSVRTIGVDNVEIVEVSPRDVDVTLEKEVAKQVTVQVNRSGQLPVGYSVGTIEASPFEARVIGAVSRVQVVQSAAVDVSLTGARTTLQGQYRLTPIDSTGAEVPRVRVEPSNAEVRIVINQQEAILVLPVQVVTQGIPAEGYRVASASPNPQVIALTGTQETLQGVTELLTDPIDVGGASADITRSASVKIPAGLRATRESVNVSIRIVPQQGERLVQVAPEVINVPPGLNATSQTTSLSVQVRGDVPLINALPPGAVRATVNTANLPEGVHVLMPEIVMPPGVSLVGVQPSQVVVVIGR